MESAPNQLQRRFDVQEPNRVWVTGITYIRTYEGWLCFAAVLDLFSRQGFCIGPDPYQTRCRSCPFRNRLVRPPISQHDIHESDLFATLPRMSMNLANQVRRRTLPGQAAWLSATLLLLVLGMIPAASHAVEEPAYTVVQAFPAFEIRRYAGYAVAEVVVAGPAQDAANRAFPILAGYIFGNNKGERKLAMTAPVTQAATPVKLDMTAPVTQSASQDGFLVQFVLPAGIDAARAPVPLDARVTLRDVPPRRVAVIRYSGFWSESNYDRHLAKLQDALRAAGIAWKGEPVLSRYNGPMTPWFMRRNEIWLALD